MLIAAPDGNSQVTGRLMKPVATPLSRRFRVSSTADVFADDVRRPLSRWLPDEEARVARARSHMISAATPTTCRIGVVETNIITGLEHRARTACGSMHCTDEPAIDTDHWTKMKVVTKDHLMPAVSSSSGWSGPAWIRPMGVPPQQLGLSRSYTQPSFAFATKTANQFNRQQGVAVPRATSGKPTIKTTLNERAKRGHKYWYLPRPAQPKFGGYSIGAQHTQLGLCNAPRS